MEQLIELLKQIQELAGVAIEALQGASEGAAEATDTEKAPEGAPPQEGGGGGGGKPPPGGGGPPPPPPER